jgi:hypothetical protein
MPMVRLDPVISKTVCSLTAVPLHLSLGLEFSKRRCVAAQAISGKHVRRPIIRIRQSLLQEDLRRSAIARLRQIEINGLAMSVNRSEQVHPFAGDSNESLVDVPSCGFSFHLALQPAIDLRTVGLSPTPNGRVIDLQAPLCHEFLEIPQTQGKSAVPSDTRRDHDRFELPFAKQRRPAGSHPANLPNSQMQHFHLMY